MKQLVICCLGSLEDADQRPNETSLFQLAFFEILREMLPNLEGQPECYDPAFTDVDKTLLGSLGYKVRNAVSWTRPFAFPLPLWHHTSRGTGVFD